MKLFAIVVLVLRIVVGIDLPHLSQRSVAALSSGEKQRTQIVGVVHRTVTASVATSTGCHACDLASKFVANSSVTLALISSVCGNANIERILSVPFPVREHCTFVHQLWELAWFQEKQIHHLHLDQRGISDNHLRHTVVLQL